MTIPRRFRALFMSIATIYFGISNTAMAAPIDLGVSHALAMARAVRLSDIHYQISFKLKEHESAIAGSETVTFYSKAAGDIPIDYRDGALQSATLNGQKILIALENGHLNLPAIAGQNIVTFNFTSNAGPQGKSITRYDDKDDGSEYFYTLFVPMDASMAFPCFDQPDLKGRFTLDVEHPAGWTVIGNTAPSNADEEHSHFTETQPISTYLFAFAAGPFAEVRSQNSGEPTVYVRKSQLARTRQEAPQVQQMAARGILYFSTYFAHSFPFPKYDLVLIPGFPFGGMEHAGATFLNEDGVLFRSTPTASDYFRRNILVLHETCHQWFGDLVTMRWFDDLWLKEGFAQYMAYKALTQLEPASSPWKHFYEDIKPAAYGIDETEGTTPIFQNIANLKDAKSAYGAIVYQKAPAILKQLEFRIGGDAFREGLRSYVKQHAFSNAEWSDLIGAFKASVAGGSAAASDIDAWANAWIKHRGMPEIDVDWSCKDGKLQHLTLNQHDILPDSLLWPISTRITLNYLGRADVQNRELRVDWSTHSINVSKAIGEICPAFVFANAGDEAYGRFLLDRKSQAAVTSAIVDDSSNNKDPLLRTMLWGALWDNVHVANSAPRGYVEVALKSLPGETDESLARVQGARIAVALHSYLHDRGRKELVALVESVIADRMLNAPTLGLRIVSFRTFTGIAETPASLRQMKDLLAGKLVIPGLTLKPLDRWNLIAHLMMMSDPDAPAIFAKEKAQDQSGEGKKYAYAAEAGMPSAQIKSRYFDEYLHSQSVQEDWITQSLRPFNSWNQTELTAPYLTRALDELPNIKQHRKIFFLGAWLGAFIDGQNSAEAQAIVHTWLAGRQIDPDLRLKILEVSDSLDRTVLIRRKFSE
jgi:aminopeptidase N